jgi:vitamin B12 transporter
MDGILTALPLSAFFSISCVDNVPAGSLELARENQMKQKLFTVALLGAIASPFCAYAETPSLGEIVVTATRMPQLLDKTIADMTVLNEQDIHNSGAPDVPTLLRSLAGVEVVQSGGLGKQSSTFMRGTNSTHVLVLLDGARINSATTGTTALEHIMLDSIERIEVVRGNVSSLYGSEAIGGVIQLFTKRGRGAPAFNASAGFGSHGTQRLAAGFSGEVFDTSFSVNVGKLKTDGVSAINTSIAQTNPDKDGYDNSTFNAQLQHVFNADHQLSVSLFSTRGDSRYDQVFDAFFNPTATTDRNNMRANIDKLSLTSDNQFNDGWHSQLRLAQGTDSSRDYLNGALSSRFETRNNQLGWQNEVTIAGNQRLNLAAERLVQSVDSDTLFTRTERSVNSLLGGYVGEYGVQQIQFNLRQDRYSDFGTANTGLIGYGLSFADNWRATASVANAFKAPTFNDLFFPSAFGFSGNPDLRPERARNNEIGLHYAAAGQRADAVYFDNRIRDLIASNDTFTTVVNVGQARIDGLELSYAGEFGGTRLKASMTLQDPRDTATGKTLLRRAKEYASIAASHNFDAWNMGAELQHSGARSDVDINTFLPTTLPGYQVLNLNARYQANKNFAVSARVDNLFNRDYMLVHGFNTPGRTLFVGLNYRQ